MEKHYHYYHYNYQIQELGETINGRVTYESGKDEQAVHQFIREDLEETFPDGAILSLSLTAITDAKGNKIS